MIRASVTGYFVRRAERQRVQTERRHLRDEMKWLTGVLAQIDLIYGRGDIVRMNIVDAVRGVYRGRIEELRSQLEASVKSK